MWGDLSYMYIYIYMEEWEAAMGKFLQCERKKKASNVKDAYPVALSVIMLWAAISYELSCETALSQRGEKVRFIIRL